MLKLMLVFKSGAIQVIVIEPMKGFSFSGDVAAYFTRVAKDQTVAEWYSDKLSGGAVFIRYSDVSFIKATEIPMSDWDSVSARTRQDLFGTAA